MFFFRSFCMLLLVLYLLNNSMNDSLKSDLQVNFKVFLYQLYRFNMRNCNINVTRVVKYGRSRWTESVTDTEENEWNWKKVRGDDTFQGRWWFMRWQYLIVSDYFIWVHGHRNDWGQSTIDPFGCSKSRFDMKRPPDRLTGL